MPYIQNTNYDVFTIISLLFYSFTLCCYLCCWLTCLCTCCRRGKVSGLQNETSETDKNSSNVQPNKIIVSIYNSRADDVLDNTLVDLKYRLSEEGFELKIIKNVTEHDSDLPLLVLCVNSSRLGSDVEYLVKDSSSIRRKALLILHQKEDHACKDSYNYCLGDQSKLFCDAFDIEFQVQNGLHDTDINKVSVDKIVNFFRSKQEEV